MNLCIDYEGERGVFFSVSLGLVVELSGLLPRQSLVFLLSGVVDEVGDDEGRGNKEEGGPDPPESVWHSSADHSGKSLLLVGREVVLRRPAHLDSQLAKAEAIPSERSAHFSCRSESSNKSLVGGEVVLRRPAHLDS